MSTTDSLSFAPDQAIRGNGKTVIVGSGAIKTSLSSSDAVSHLLAGTSWSRADGIPATVTYAFRRTGTVPADEASGFGLFNAAQMAQAEKALAAWSDVANIRFTKVADADGYSDNATILFGNFDDGPGAGFTVYPGPSSFYTRPTSAAGDVWINGSLSYNQTPTTGNYGGNVLVHEIGHSIGLSHPSDYDVDTDPNYGANADYYEDSGQYTVMSYFEEVYTGAGFGRDTYAAAPLIDDIAAAQRLYGANMSTRTGDTVYGFNSTAGREWFVAGWYGAKVVMAVWDAGGNDTFDFSGFSQPQSIDLRQGAFSNVGGWTGNVAVAYGATIENAIGGAGNDTIVGNSAGNVLTGNGGADELFGEGGNDTLRGGDGTDRLDGGSGTNVIDGGTGSDTLVLPGVLGDFGSYLNTDGSWTISGSGVTDIVSNIETVSLLQAGTVIANGRYSFQAFVDATLRAAPAGAYSYAGLADFNGDGRSDVAWRNTNGAVSTWSSAGSSGQLLQSTFAGAADASWRILETFDWNGDGRSDILWRHSGGTFSIWNGSAGGFQVGTYTDGSVSNDWSIAAVGDVNADGKDDLLWRGRDGAVSTWTSQGSGFQQTSFYHAPVGNDWKIEGMGDTNGDGRADILWRQDGGAISVWSSTGAGFNETTYYNGSVGRDWHIEAIADLNGDRRDDLIWRNDDGRLSLWHASGSGFTFIGEVANPGLDWQIAQVGDFNGDGRADILWLNNDGRVSTWQSNGSSFDQGIYSSNVTPGWSVAAHDYPL